MEFGRSQDGRPEGTSEVRGGWVIHYTCNAPNLPVLDQVGIRPVGTAFGVGPREVLLIPRKLFGEKEVIGEVEAENLLRRLG